MDFYYRFVIPNRSLIELGRTKFVLTEIEERLNLYISNHWEKICRQAVSGNTINGISYHVASRWWGHVSRDEMLEFDVVALSVDKKSILVGECKWHSVSNSEAIITNLTEKAQKAPFTKGKDIVPVLFVKDCNTLSNNTLSAETIISLS